MNCLKFTTTAFLLFILSVSCEKNHPPEIIELNCLPESGSELTEFMFTGIGLDPDGDKLSYTWTASSGKFIGPANEAIVKWKSSDIDSDTVFIIKLFLNDGYTIVSEEKSIQVQCIKNNPPVINKISCDPISGLESTQFTLSANVWDIDADPLSYSWTSNEGHFLGETNAMQVKWLSPNISVDTTFVISLTVKDSIHTVKKDKNISVKHKIFPAEVKTLSVHTITDSSATISGEVTFDGDDLVMERGICWSIEPMPTIYNHSSREGSGEGRFQSSLTYLSRGTQYYVRAYATNSLRTSYGNQIEFTTLDFIPITGRFTDPRDNRDYNWVKIDNTYWMQENLAWLPAMNNYLEESNTDPKYYIYNFDGSLTDAKKTNYFKTYGVLYNWPAALISCPTGWKLPTFNDWLELLDYLGGSQIAGGKMKETGITHWKNPNLGATNSSLLTVLPAGDRSYWPGFFYLYETAFFWTSDGSGTNASSISLSFESSTVRTDDWGKSAGFSVRCIKDL